jgi:hypothetical protein
MHVHGDCIRLPADKPIHFGLLQHRIHCRRPDKLVHVLTAIHTTCRPQRSRYLSDRVKSPFFYPHTSARAAMHGILYEVYAWRHHCSAHLLQRVVVHWSKIIAPARCSHVPICCTFPSEVQLPRKNVTENIYKGRDEASPDGGVSATYSRLPLGMSGW